MTSCRLPRAATARTREQVRRTFADVFALRRSSAIAARELGWAATFDDAGAMDARKTVRFGHGPPTATTVIVDDAVRYLHVTFRARYTSLSYEFAGDDEVMRTARLYLPTGMVYFHVERGDPIKNTCVIPCHHRAFRDHLSPEIAGVYACIVNHVDEFYTL